MEAGQEIVDYYRLLQVDPDCDARILEIAYHHFAKMYHPDNAETADTTKFGAVLEAYRVLKDPQRRSEYDQSYNQIREKYDDQFPIIGDVSTEQDAAIIDDEMRERILLILYKRRRKVPSEPGVGGWLIQERLSCSYENFEFYVWYLKSKGFIDVTEEGTWAITIDGVDHVIATSRVDRSKRLLITEEDAGEE